ncbi:hypothetical protein [Legionella cardiaca]|uniref:Uncharacterized protein n=1 Tax=Legionella cardiaca TaxID=1071983 RepID=A0ABY8ANX1_9GAMM|nr:hypothetical protein [Legionella cardiaca]WED42365.1 hypothetical protein PXX05_10595 [Legionella cardiaca]
MSKTLDQFKNSYYDYVKYNTALVAHLATFRLDLFLKVATGRYNFSDDVWATFDNKTVAEFKALAIYYQIGQKLLPILYPDITCEPKKTTPPGVLLNPRKLTPLQLSQAFDAIKEITEHALHETLANRPGTEVILDFLKACLNFLITLVTFGQKKDIFKSTTYHLEKISKIQNDMHNILDKLEKDEKDIELEKPTLVGAIK